MFTPTTTTHIPPKTVRIVMLDSMSELMNEMKKNAMVAKMVSAVAAPSPEASPDLRFLLSVRCMHNTPTGPNVIEAVRPMITPLRKISIHITLIIDG